MFIISDYPSWVRSASDEHLMIAYRMAGDEKAALAIAPEFDPEAWASVRNKRLLIEAEVKARAITALDHFVKEGTQIPDVEAAPVRPIAEVAAEVSLDPVTEVMENVKRLQERAAVTKLFNAPAGGKKLAGMAATGLFAPQ